MTSFPRQKQVPVVLVLEKDHAQIAEGATIETLSNKLQEPTRQKGRPEAGHVGNEGDPQRSCREGAKDVVFDGVAENRIRPLLAEYFSHATDLFAVLQRVETFHTHLEGQEPASKTFDRPHAVVMRRQDSDAVAVGYHGLDEGAAGNSGHSRPR